MTSQSAPMCLYCTHYKPKAPGYRCDAYPEGIPTTIIQGKVDHRKPFHGDNGIVFKLKNPADAQDFKELVIEPMFGE